MAVLYLGSRRLPGMVERLADLSAARELRTWDATTGQSNTLDYSREPPASNLQGLLAYKAAPLRALSTTRPRTT